MSDVYRRMNTRYAILSVALLLGACMPEADEKALSAAETETLLLEKESVLSQDSTAPLELGQVPNSASKAQQLALWWVNTYRMRAGLGPLDERQTLNNAASKHAEYVLSNTELYEDDGLSVHEQDSDYDGFTGERFWERLEAADYAGHAFREVIAYQSNPGAAIAHWMETAYHRLPLIHPSARHIGYGERFVDNRRINVMDLGSGDGIAPVLGSGVAWPAPGASNVAVSWDGVETPKPRAPAGGFPSGPVVSLSFAAGTELVVESHTLEDTTTGVADVAHTTLTPENDPNLEHESAVVMYADAPLTHGHTYTVTIRGSRNGTPFKKTWSFTTEFSSQCDLIAQSCNVGKGCYGSANGGTECVWEGRGESGSLCTYQNDCSGGSTCANGVCRRYCEIGTPSSDACVNVCPGGYALLANNHVTGVCQ